MVELCVRAFNMQDLINSAWAFAKVGWSNVPLFTVIAEAVE